MKKVLLLTHEYYPFRGGVARYVYNLFRHFAKDRYLVVTDNPQVKRGDNIINMQLTSRFVKPGWLLSFLKLRSIFKQSQADIIFTPNILPLGTLAYFLFKFFHIPYIISLHGFDIRLALKNKKSLTKKILQNAELILVNSKDTRGYISNFGLPMEKIHLFYPTADKQTHYDKAKLTALRQNLNIKDSDHVLLTVGRLTQRKGQDLVIKAIRNLRGFLDVKYLIVGQGENKAELEKLIRVYKLDSRVKILDNISDDNLVYYYKLANIFVLPNRFTDTDVEGFGIVFLEAASAGLAIIAGRSGGVTEILANNENAILIENENIGQLTEAITMLLNNPHKADKLAQEAKQRYQQFLNSRAQSDKLKQLLSV